MLVPANVLDVPNSQLNLVYLIRVMEILWGNIVALNNVGSGSLNNVAILTSIHKGQENRKGV